MSELTGYARCSTVLQDLTAQREALAALGFPDDRIHVDKGLSGTSRARPRLDEALAAVRSGDTLVVPKLDRLARSVPDARHIGDSLVACRIKLSVGGAIYDPAEPLGKMFLKSWPPSPNSKSTCSGSEPGRAWPSPVRRESSGQAAQAHTPRPGGVGEYGLALEDLAAMLTYDKIAISDQERGDIVALARQMSMDPGPGWPGPAEEL